MSTPRLVSAGSPATLSLLDTRARSGPARLTAFPQEQDVAADPARSLRNVLGFYIDKRNAGCGRWTWAFVAGEAEAPAGAQKVMVYDPRTGRTVKRILLDGAADRKGSFLNDIAVDERRRVAYASTAACAAGPRATGLIVVDFDTAARGAHCTTMPARRPSRRRVVSHGADVWPGNPLVTGHQRHRAVARRGHAVLGRDDRHARPCHAHPALRNGASEAALAATIRDLGDAGGNTDGIVTDAQGNLYITDVTRNGIVKYDPRTQAMTLLAADAGVRWPDTPGDPARRPSGFHREQPEPALRRRGQARRGALRAVAPALGAGRLRRAEARRMDENTSTESAR